MSNRKASIALALTVTLGALGILSCSKKESLPTAPSDQTAPAAVTDLQVVSATESTLTLAWTAPGDDGSSGTAAGYEIRMSTAPITESNYSSATVVDSTLQPQSAGTAETYTVTGLASWKDYYFCLKTRDEAGNWSGVSNSPWGRTKLPIAQPYHLDTGGSAYFPSWSPDGSTIAFNSNRSGNHEIWTIRATGGTPLQLTNNPANDGRPYWSPDGSTIAFHSDRSGNYDIWTIPATGGFATQLTTDAADDYWPSWSPDGSTIAFNSDRSGNFDIWTIPAAGGTATRVTTNTMSDFHPSWSPDGTKIAFYSNRSGNYDIWTIPATGGTATQVTTNVVDDRQPAWSPDGSTIAFSSLSMGTYDIWTVAATGGAATQVTTDVALDHLPAWSPDGSMIAFSSNRSGTMDIWIIRVK